MRNGHVKFGQFLSFFAGVVMGNTEFDAKWYAVVGFIALAVVLDFIAISHIDKGVKEIEQGK